MHLINSNLFGTRSVTALDSKSDLTFFDLLLIVFLICGLSVIVFVLLQLLHIETSNERLIFVYCASVLCIVVPAFYARIKNKAYFRKIVFFNETGFFDINLLLGILTGLILAIAFRLTPLWHLLDTFSQLTPKKEIRWTDFLFFPITALGFQNVILGPIAEEVLHRGVIYNYLKNRMNVFVALFIQGFIFSISHINSITSDLAICYLLYYFFIGFVLGLLYEKTGRLITSIACHGTFNYLILIFSVCWK